MAEPHAYIGGPHDSACSRCGGLRESAAHELPRQPLRDAVVVSRAPFVPNTALVRAVVAEIRADAAGDADPAEALWRATPDRQAAHYRAVAEVAAALPACDPATEAAIDRKFSAASPGRPLVPGDRLHLAPALLDCVGGLLEAAERIEALERERDAARGAYETERSLRTRADARARRLHRRAQAAESRAARINRRRAEYVRWWLRAEEQRDEARALCEQAMREGNEECGRLRVERDDWQARYGSWIAWVEQALTADGAAMEALQTERDALASAARGLLAALPTCEASTGARGGEVTWCGAPATRRDAGFDVCDAHGERDARDLPHAAALRALAALTTTDAAEGPQKG